MTAGATTATGRWTLDAVASTASFTAHQLWMDVKGTVPLVSGSVEIGSDGELLAAAAELDLAAIDTGNAHRERDLAKPALLDLGAHPRLTIEVGPGERTADGWAAPASIRARGQVCPLTVQVTVGDLDAAGGVQVRVTAVLDRTPLRMRPPRLAIGRWIQIDVTAVFSRDEPAERHGPQPSSNGSPT